MSYTSGWDRVSDIGKGTSQHVIVEAWCRTPAPNSKNINLNPDYRVRREFRGRSRRVQPPVPSASGCSCPTPNSLIYHFFAEFIKPTQFYKFNILANLPLFPPIDLFFGFIPTFQIKLRYISHLPSYTRLFFPSSPGSAP